jgi:hypothetical protein
VFDILVSADAFVPDHAEALRRVSAELGIRQLDRRHVIRVPDQRAQWSFSPVHPDRRVAPTLLELLAPLTVDPDRPLPPDYAYLPEIAAAQTHRPARLHSTVIGVPEVRSLADRLATRGAPFRLDEPSELLPFPRLWLGFGGARPETYRPDADGGLHLEFIPTEVLRLPPEGPPDRIEVASGSPVRIEARTILVDDLSDTLGRLEDNLGLVPAGATTTCSDGTRRARLEFRYPGSAAVELIEARPTATGYPAEFARRYGPGACSIRLEVADLTAFRARLVSAGVPILEPEDLDGRRRLIRPAEAALGSAFEFIEWEPANPRPAGRGDLT